MCTRRIIVETDHKPLESIFRKPLNEAPPRLQRMLLNSLSMTLWCVMFAENSRSFETALAEHLSVKLEPFSEPEDVIGVNLVEELGAAP